jgi:hypothetical protein
MLAPARSRCRRCVRGGWLSVGLLGSDAWGYALLMGGGFWVPVALRVWRWWLSRGWGSAGSVLCSQGSSREHGLSRCVRGMSVIASNARSGPTPLPPVRAWWVAICWSFGIGRLGLRFDNGWRFLGAGCVAGLAMGMSRGWGSAGSVLCSQGSSREHGLSRCARGMSVIASNARSGPIPLPPGIILSIGVWRDWGGGPAWGGVESGATTRVRQKYDIICASIAIP